jgi:hypothetical protein
MTATLEKVQLSLPLGPWTEQDYLSMPDADGFRVELIDGMLIVLSQPDGRHQKIATRLTREFERLLPDHLDALSSVNVRLGPDRIVGPDVVVTCDLSDSKIYQATSVLLVEREPTLELTLLRHQGMGYAKHASAAKGDVLDLPELECSIEVDALLRRR